MIKQSKKRCKRWLVVLCFVGGQLGAPWIQGADLPDWCKKIPRPQFAKLEKVATNSNWFQVYRVRPNVFAISEPRQFEEVISYLIIGSRRALLWDTGMGISKIRPVVERLTSLHVFVLNSHTHPDHIGGNYEFDNVWAFETDFTKQNSEGKSDPDMKTWVSNDAICGTLPADFKASEYSTKPFHITRFVKDGEVIDLGDRKLQVLSTPGHTPDSLSLLDQENRFLLTGDTFYPGPIYLYSPETDFKAYIRSVERLVSYQKEIDDLLTAHNEPLAPASSLSKLKQALVDLQAGKIRPIKKDGLKEFAFDGFSILIK